MLSFSFKEIHDSGQLEEVCREHTRLCLSPQVSGVRVVVGYTELTPFQGVSVYSASLRVPSRSLASSGHPWLPDSTIHLPLLPRLQSAHLPSLRKTRRAGIPRPERPAATAHAPSSGRFGAASRFCASRIPPAAARPPPPEQAAGA